MDKHDFRVEADGFKHVFRRVVDDGCRIKRGNCASPINGTLLHKERGKTACELRFTEGKGQDVWNHRYLYVCAGTAQAWIEIDDLNLWNKLIDLKNPVITVI